MVVVVDCLCDGSGVAFTVWAFLWFSPGKNGIIGGEKKSLAVICGSFGSRGAHLSRPHMRKPSLNLSSLARQRSCYTRMAYFNGTEVLFRFMRLLVCSWSRGGCYYCLIKLQRSSWRFLPVVSGSETRSTHTLCCVSRTLALNVAISPHKLGLS